MRKVCFLLILFVILGSVPLASVDALAPAATCKELNSINPTNSVGVRLNQGDRLTVTINGTFNSLSFQGDASASRTTNGTLRHTANGLEIVYIVLDLGGKGNEVDLDYSCKPAGESDSDEPLSPPCDNLYDGRINNNQGLDCGEPVAIYLNPIRIFGIDPTTGAGMDVMDINADILKGSVPDSNTLLSEGTNIVTGQWIRVYWLPATNEIELITAYSDGKPYIVVWPVDHPELLYHLAA